MFKIRLLSPFRKEFITEEYLFSREITLENADALLCEWSPQEELLTFRGPKALYHCEAIQRKLFRQPKWEPIFSNKTEQTFIYHAHPNPFYRVPMISFVEPLLELNANHRLSRVIAVISNCGNLWSSEDIVYRNRFVMHKLVDLYGKRKNWQEYMQANSLQGSLPTNYKGEIEGSWHGRPKLETMSRYKVSICLENVTEPYYITEKFYSVAQAGCIPIYHAHETVSNGVLKGAMWVDPSDFGFDIDRTIEFALAQNRRLYADSNLQWLHTDQAYTASERQVFLRLGEILTKNLRK